MYSGSLFLLSGSQFLTFRYVPTERCVVVRVIRPQRKIYSISKWFRWRGNNMLLLSICYLRFLWSYILSMIIRISVIQFHYFSIIDLVSWSCMDHQWFSWQWPSILKHTGSTIIPSPTCSFRLTIQGPYSNCFQLTNRMLAWRLHSHEQHWNKFTLNISIWLCAGHLWHRRQHPPRWVYCANFTDNMRWVGYGLM